MPRRATRASGSALTATTLKKPKRKATGDGTRRARRGRSARADRQQDFLAERILELLELQRGLTFITQYFEDRGPAFLGHFHAAALDIHDMHLQRFDQKVPVVAAIRTGQRHL